MSTKKPIVIKKSRDFGKVMSDTFSLFFQNFKLFAKVFLKIVMPVLVLGSLGVLVVAFMASGFDPVNPDFDEFPMVPAIILGIIYVLFIFLFIYCFLKIMVVAYRFVKLKSEDAEYAVTEGDLLNDIGGETMAMLGKVFQYMALLIPIMVVFGGLQYLLINLIGPSGIILLFIALPILMYFTVATSLYMVVFFHERIGFIDSLKRSMELIKGKWWLTFALTMVISMIANSISSFIQYVPMIFVMIGAALLPEDGSGLSLFISVMGIFAVFIVVLTFVFYIINYIFQSIWYHSLVEDKEGTSIIDKINQIGEDNGEVQFS